MLYKRLLLLPKDIVQIEIFKFLSKKQLLFTNKKNYEKNIIKYRLLELKNCGLSLDSYIRNILINKMNYIFYVLINDKYKHWINIKKYKYKAYKYRTFIDLLEQLCYDLNSTKCRNVILNYEKKNNNVRKKKNKKMKHINIKWTN